MVNAECAFLASRYGTAENVMKRNRVVDSDKA